MKTLSNVLPIVIACYCTPQTAWSNESHYETTGEWVAPRGTEERQFGKCVAIDGRWIAVATDRGEDGTFDPGSVRLYQTNNPNDRPVGLLRAPNRQWPDEFGSSIAFHENQLLIGAPGDSEVDWDCGAAWMFDYRDSWRLTSALTPTTVEAGDRFGDSVSIDGTWAAVGAPRSDRAGLDAGAVHLFRVTEDQWVESEVIVAPDASVADFFGDCVALSDTWLAVGAWGDDDHGEKTGSVWIFHRERERWHPVQKIVPEESRSRDLFGCSLALSEEWLLVGSSGWNTNQGCIYAFKLVESTWESHRQLHARGGREQEWSGYSLSMKNGLAVAGAPGRSDGIMTGGIDLFTLKAGTWHWLQRVGPSGEDWQQPNQFGWSVATDGRRIMVGRIDDADGPAEAGRVWMVEPLKESPKVSTPISEPINPTK